MFCEHDRQQCMMCPAYEAMPGQPTGCKLMNAEIAASRAKKAYYEKKE